MVIEHTFVTTMEAEEALRTASEFLRRHGGFEPEADRAFQLGRPGWNVIELKRGKKSASRAKLVSELAQQIRMEWDRGRVTLAASIAPRTGAFYGTDTSPRHVRNRLAAELMTAIARSLELLLAYRMPPEQAARPWDQAQAQVDEQRRREKRRNVIAWTVVVLILVGLLALSIWVNTR